MIGIIPKFDLFSYSMLIDIDGGNYRLRLTYNQRFDSYSLSVYTDGDIPLIEGIPLTLNVSLLGKYVDPRLPPGSIYCVPNQAGITKVGSEEFPNVDLVYISDDEE